MDEFKNRYLMSAEAFEQLKTQFDLNAETSACRINSVNVPSELDLRSLRTVTPIRMQGGCGSCWAFSGVAATESAYLAYRNTSLDLSEQELVDCASQHGCHGDTIPRLDPFPIKITILINNHNNNQRHRIHPTKWCR